MRHAKLYAATGTIVAAILSASPARSAVVGGVDLGNLTNNLFVFTDGSVDANWQGATKGFVGDVAVDGIHASERTSGGVPYKGTLYTNDTSLGAWQAIVTQNTAPAVAVTQAFRSLNQVAMIAGLESNLNNAFSQINALPATTGYTSVSSSVLGGLNTQNGINETFVMNITSGLTVNGTVLNVTGDAGDVFILRWDTSTTTAGYQGQVKFQSGGAINPLGGLTPGNFINVAGDIASSGGGGNPSGLATYLAQIPAIENGSNVNGGGFFTGYWLTTGDPTDHETSSLSNAIFVGGWYTDTTKFSMTSGTSGVYVVPVPEPGLLMVGLSSCGLLLLRRSRRA